MERKKILFISYFFPPFEAVGTKRIAYWHNHIDKFNYESFVFTAIKQIEKHRNITYVEPEHRKTFLSYFIKDKGVAWINPLKKALLKHKADKFDFILISGGPFMQMLITKFIKKNFNTKVILDFRDPFYANPRFPKSKIKDSIKLLYQNKFLKNTDIVITVNSECKKLINHNNIELIDNGFDDDILNKIKLHSKENKNTKNKFLAVATGRIDKDFNTDSFFEALKQDKDINFEYIGNHKFDNYNDLYKHGGILPYPAALNFINDSDFCVLFTGGLAFESSTKIFDYLGLNKTILIITDGTPNTGSLEAITNDYPNIYWAENRKQEILKAFSRIKSHKNIKIDTRKYSRAEGLKVLTQILER